MMEVSEFKEGVQVELLYFGAKMKPRVFGSVVGNWIVWEDNHKSNVRSNIFKNTIAKSCIKRK